MIKSMTAYAQATQQVEGLELAVEIRSYNSRHLDLNLRLPFAYMALEDRIKKTVQERIERGRVELRIQVRETDAAACSFEVDENRARAYVDALTRLKSLFDLPDPLTLDTLTAAGDLIRPVEVERDLDARWPVIEAALKEALDGLERMRLREGASLAADFRSRLERLESLLSEIEHQSEGLLSIYHERLLDRISSLMSGGVDIDPARIAQEAATLAERSDISEEIVRTRSHIGQFREIMAAAAPAGRTLNFLLQEFNREFNTMGSKTTRSDVAHLVVEAKSEVEKIREQVQNVE